MSRIKFQINGDAEIDALLAKIPKLVVAAGGPLDRAVGKAGTVIAKRARQIAPNSKRSGTEKKQSAKSKAKWKDEVRRNIKSVVRKYSGVAVAVVGATHPEGNAAHFMQEKPRKHVLWGKKTVTYRIARNWITQAFDETKSEQQSAMATSLKDDLDKVMRGG